MPAVAEAGLVELGSWGGPVRAGNKSNVALFMYLLGTNP